MDEDGMLNFMINQIQNDEMTVSIYEKLCYYNNTWNDEYFHKRRIDKGINN